MKQVHISGSFQGSIRIECECGDGTAVAKAPVVSGGVQELVCRKCRKVRRIIRTSAGNVAVFETK